MVENKALVEELAREGPLVFYDDLVTLNDANYHRDS